MRSYDVTKALKRVAWWSRAEDSLHKGSGAAAVDGVVLIGAVTRAADKHIGDDCHFAPF